MAQEPVKVNVYNMHWLNEYISNLGIGIYHSGIEVYGKEYAFGGHPFEFTGIFDMAPCDVEELGDGFTFKESILLGHTDFVEKDIKKLIEMMGRSFSGVSYHLIKKNCNHFSTEFSKLVCGKNVPNWINRLAAIGIRFPLLVQCIPKDWLTPDPGGSYDFIDMTEWVEIENFPDNSSSKTVLSFNDVIMPDCDKSISDIRDRKYDSVLNVHTESFQELQVCKNNLNGCEYSVGYSEPVALLDALNLLKPIDSSSENEIVSKSFSLENESGDNSKDCFSTDHDMHGT